MDVEAQLRALLEHSYSPYSRYRVAAVLRADDGKLYPSVNVENASYPLSTCAERGAVNALIAAGGKRILEVWVMTQGPEPGTPCGGCRQILAEFADDDVAIHCLTPSGNVHHYTVGSLLPHAFRLNRP